MCNWFTLNVWLFCGFNFVHHPNIFFKIIKKFKSTNNWCISFHIRFIKNYFTSHKLGLWSQIFKDTYCKNRHFYLQNIYHPQLCSSTTFSREFWDVRNRPKHKNRFCLFNFFTDLFNFLIKWTKLYYILLFYLLNLQTLWNGFRILFFIRK